MHKLLARRNDAADEEIERIDAELVELLYPWCKLTYVVEEGCGSMFEVHRTSDGKVYLRRARFY